jgi:transglutaminase-like putative cysteine protease
MVGSTTEDLGVYLRATAFIDCDHPAVVEFAESSAEGAADETGRAVRIFYGVRDRIQYDPYGIDLTEERFKASAVLGKKSGYCVEKALLLAAAARAVDIPSRLRFADVRNHLTTERLRQIMKTDRFIWHGYTEMFLKGRWVKATPTFNLSLCERFDVKPLDFDGVHDAVFHEFDRKGNRHMEYLYDHGPFADLPYEMILAAFREHYPMYFTREREEIAGDFTAEALRERS